MSDKYVFGFDLPCYPNAKPQPMSRKICGVERRASRKFMVWIGGCGRGEMPSLKSARRELFDVLESDIREKIADGERRVLYYEKMLQDVQRRRELSGSGDANG